MNDKKIRKLVLAALLAALVCVATMVVQIPSPMQGYVNLGDCFVLLSGWLLGPWYGFAAGGIGSMLADIFLGYAHYAPGTLVIKGVMALVAALMYEKMGRTATSRHRRRRCERDHHGARLFRLRFSPAGQGPCRCGKHPRQHLPGCGRPRGRRAAGHGA